MAMTDSSATVTGTASTVLAAEPNRRVLILLNRSTDTIWFKFSGTATVGGAGCLALVGQGANLMLRAGIGPDIKDSISAISSGSSSGLTILTVP